MTLLKGLGLVCTVSLLAACGSDSDDTISEAAYSFNSVVDSATGSSVSYSGQATRQLLISELKALIGSDELQQVASKQEALDKLNLVYALGTGDSDTLFNLVEADVYTGSSTATAVNLSLKSENTSLKQTDFSVLSGGKNLKSKMAGQDNDLSRGAFFGWDITANTEAAKPDLLIQEWFDAIATLAADDDDTTRFVSTTGLDYQQLVQKFLLGAVTYSQTAEDYFKADKGLLAQNSAGDKDGAKNYTGLEHHWDEGFGYFGAARDYSERTDAEIKASVDFDQNQDGLIDLYAEYNFGHSVNAVKRDIGATDAVDYSTAAFNAFLAGRMLIQDNYGTDPVLDDGYHVQLNTYAQTALNNWEKAVASTVVHYINEVIVDLNSLDTASRTSDASIAKHWSEMKGFALSLQFNVNGLISDNALTSVHANFAQAPVLSDLTARTAYITQLEAARATLQTAYDFSAANVTNW